MLYVKRGANDVIEASIKCNCGRLIILTKKDENFQLSNYQKHLRKKLKLQQAADGLTSSNSVVSASVVSSQEQKAEPQVPADLSTDSLSVRDSLTLDTQTTISQTNIRKRSQPSSQSSFQKTKRHRG
ncbi:hypothetical protein I4U23_010790 [Adineta vaga]|nr:hypothetical protein I4U23_010790 [Adineta vaga]